MKKVHGVNGKTDVTKLFRNDKNGDRAVMLMELYI